jgi:hypothetical protein
MKATKKVVVLLKKWLKVDRVWVVIEWLDVNHAHIKLYPFYDNIWFQYWVWSWSKESLNSLINVAEEIKKNNI